MVASQVSIASVYANGWKLLKIIDTSRWVLLPIVQFKWRAKMWHGKWCPKLCSFSWWSLQPIECIDYWGQYLALRQKWEEATCRFPAEFQNWSMHFWVCEMIFLNLWCFTVFKGIHKFGALTTPSSWEPIVWIIISEKSCTAGEYPSTDTSVLKVSTPPSWHLGMEWKCSFRASLQQHAE